jgi:hypothetical protein
MEDNKWGQISSELSRAHLIEGYVRDILADQRCPQISEARSVRNIVQGISKGSLQDRDFVMSGNKLKDIRNVVVDEGILKVCPKK